jgi:hypothetical protein
MMDGMAAETFDHLYVMLITILAVLRQYLQHEACVLVINFLYYAQKDYLSIEMCAGCDGDF